jgi:hypothetical protein
LCWLLGEFPLSEVKVSQNGRVSSFFNSLRLVKVNNLNVAMEGAETENRPPIFNILFDVDAGRVPALSKINEETHGFNELDFRLFSHNLICFDLSVNQRKSQNIEVRVEVAARNVYSLLFLLLDPIACLLQNA